MSNIFRDSESWGKSNGKKRSNIWTFLFGSGLKPPRKKSFFLLIFPYKTWWKPRFPMDYWVFGYFWTTLLWHRCYYPHRSRDALSPVCGIFFYICLYFLPDLLGLCYYHQTLKGCKVTYFTDLLLIILLDSCVYRCFALGLTSARGRMGAFLLSSQTTQYWCSWCLIIKASNIIIEVLVWGLDRSPPRSPAFRLLPPLVSIMWWLSSVFVTGGLTYPAGWSCCHAFVKCRVNTYLIV